MSGGAGEAVECVAVAAIAVGLLDGDATGGATCQFSECYVCFRCRHGESFLATSIPPSAGLNRMTPDGFNHAGPFASFEGTMTTEVTARVYGAIRRRGQQKQMSFRRSPASRPRAASSGCAGREHRPHPGELAFGNSWNSISAASVLDWQVTHARKLFFRAFRSIRMPFNAMTNDDFATTIAP